MSTFSSSNAIEFILGLLLLILAYNSLWPQQRTTGDPPGVAYLIPWIGSGASYWANPEKFLRKCHTNHGSIYRILLAGRRMTVLASTSTISILFQNPFRSFSNYLVHYEMLKAIGGAKGNRVPYLHEVMERRLFPIIARSLSPRAMTKLITIINGEILAAMQEMADEEEKQTLGEPRTLTSFVIRSLYRAMSIAVFGPMFPLDTIEDFQQLDTGLPGLLAGFPFADKNALRARGRLLVHIQSYYNRYRDMDDGGLADGVSELMSSSILELKEARLSGEEAASLILSFMWGAYSNTLRTAFWLMAYILSNSNAHEQVVQEVCTSQKYPTLKSLEDISQETLIAGEVFPLLHSSIYEILRWSLLSTTVRITTKYTTILADGKKYLLKKGEHVMGDVRAIHEDGSLYSDPARVQIDRFCEGGTAKQPKETISAPPKPQVWGGGAHLCKGRHFALYVIQFFLLCCFQSFDVIPLPRREGEEVTPPEIDPRSMGIRRPKSDMSIKLAPRIARQDRKLEC